VNLRLPQTISKKDKISVAESVISELGLMKCQNTIIGNSFIRGISGRSMHVARDRTPPGRIACLPVATWVDGEGFQDKRAREMVHEDDLVATMLSPESRIPERSRPEHPSATTLGHVGGLVRSSSGGFFLKRAI
jgi:hypothetical protein